MLRITGEYPEIGEIVKLSAPVECGVAASIGEPQQCEYEAFWSLNGVAVCDVCILDILERLPDNREWLQPALESIKAVHMRIGSRVRIQYGNETGNLGTVYNYLPSRPAQWHVRPDGWPADVAGIAYKIEELDLMPA